MSFTVGSVVLSSRQSMTINVFPSTMTVGRTVAGLRSVDGL